MDAQQLPLFGHNLPPLKLRDRVRVIAEGYIGTIAQINIPGDRYAVYTVPWRGQPHETLPVYRRDELELINE